MKTRSQNRLFALALILGFGLSLVLAGRAAALSFTNLHSLVFTNGTDPVAGLILSGNTLYGTARTYGGGNGGGSGSVFKFNTDGSGFTNLHTFSGGVDGGSLNGSLTMGGGVLYGTAAFGGSSAYGAVFAIGTNGTGLTNVYSFPATSASSPYSNSAGAYPIAGMIWSGGILYGTASSGGAFGWGTVFAVGANSAGFTNLHSFNVSDGQFPSEPLILSGNTLYGTSADGGSFNQGTIFKLNVDGSGFTNIYGFTTTSGALSTNSDGAAPSCGLLLSGGTLYGTTSKGGKSGNGTVFKINTNGSDFTVLHEFTATSGPLQTNSDGANSQAGLVQFSNILYGTASVGGASGNGTVFQVKTDGTDFSTLYSFTATNAATATNLDGAHPVGGLVYTNGVLYGTTGVGGTAGYGTIFSILAPPQLNIAVSGTNVILTWPTNIGGFNLQSATNLAPPGSWSAVSGQFAVTNPVSGRQKFFRLMHP